MPFSFTLLPNAQEILQIPGYLFWGAIGLDSENKWGTLLGYCENGMFFEPKQRYREFTEEETGEEIVKILYLGSSPRVTVVLKNYNETAIARLFPGLSDSSKILFPGSILAGHELSPHNDYLLFVPDDKERNPCCLLQSAWPHLLGTAKLQFSHSKKLMFSCVFVGKRKTSDPDGIAYIGPISEAILR